MSETNIRLNGEHIKITISGPSTRFSGVDLHTAAISELIEQADTNFEEKLNDHDAAGEFYASVLTAIADRYASDCEEFGVVLNRDRLSVAQVIRRLLTDLKARGVL
ncbi:hypothetical protein [Roseisolibacter agri]|uniref:Uncharacterized protein n=1 Tax=Roseisolibacter agri TaxID=2014610 RepID=A0AA37QFC8_9BACT|nr:hypothetical protein [Roseisolibacter agri]GLC25773.1 hypothetical protein rosag_22860 [Roseisolibacter agri]